MPSGANPNGRIAKLLVGLPADVWVIDDSLARHLDEQWIRIGTVSLPGSDRTEHPFARSTALVSTVEKVQQASTPNLTRALSASGWTHGLFMGQIACTAFGPGLAPSLCFALQHHQQTYSLTATRVGDCDPLLTVDFSAATPSAMIVEVAQAVRTRTRST